MGKKSKVKEEPLDDSAMDTSQVESSEAAEVDYDHLCQFLNPIAQPLANKKLAKKVYKLLKKASKVNSSEEKPKVLEQGVKNTRRALRKGAKGVMILAGDVTPIDIYSHMPAWCEELDIPYVFTPSREHLGLAMGLKRPVIMVLVKRSDAYGDVFDYVDEALKNLPPTY